MVLKIFIGTVHKCFFSLSLLKSERKVFPLNVELNNFRNGCKLYVLMLLLDLTFQCHTRIAFEMFIIDPD